MREADIDFTGFGKNYEDSRKDYVVEKNGESVCIITVCEHEYSYALEDRMGSRPFDCFDTISDVRKAKEKYDRVIVIYHGGKELRHRETGRPDHLRHKRCRSHSRYGIDLQEIEAIFSTDVIDTHQAAATQM